MSLEAELAKVVTGAAATILADAIRNVGKRRRADHVSVAKRMAQASSIEAAADALARADHAARRAAKRKVNR